jgi:hypothetical protein
VVLSGTVPVQGIKGNDVAGDGEFDADYDEGGHLAACRT